MVDQIWNISWLAVQLCPLNDILLQLCPYNIFIDNRLVDSLMLLYNNKLLQLYPYNNIFIENHLVDCLMLQYNNKLLQLYPYTSNNIFIKH